MGDKIDQPLEEYLLATYEEEPFPGAWSEQDLYEQIRKLILQYEQENLYITIPCGKVVMNHLKTVIYSFVMNPIT